MAIDKTRLVIGSAVELCGFPMTNGSRGAVSQGKAKVNPRTGAHVSIGEKSLPAFRTGKEMRERLNRTVGA